MPSASRTSSTRSAATARARPPTGRWASGRRLPGVGHPLYPDGDPRGAELLARAASACRRRPAAQVDRGRARQLGLEPSLDIGLAAICRAHRLPPGAAFDLFALGRSVGWVAHALEAAADGRLIRPRSRYTGPAPGAVG